jgi:hypothetical protein
MHRRCEGWVVLSGGGSLRCIAAAALGAMLLFAAAADARPWNVRTVATSGPALSRGIDVLPSGKTVVLLQRASGGLNRLELRTGGRTRLLDRSPSVFLDTDAQHDAHGRLVVTWRRSLQGGGALQAFAWTPKGGKQQVSANQNGVNAVSLSVALSGRAAIAYRATESIFVARRAPGGAFQRPETVAAAGADALLPAIGVTSGARIVVAWTDGRRILLRAALGTRPFGPAQLVALRQPDPGATLVTGAPKLVLTDDGRAVVAVSSAELRGLSVIDRRVEAFEWTATASHPSATATLSRGAAAGVVDAVATGNTVAIGWTQRSPRSPRALWITRWTKKGIQRPNVYDTRALESPVLLTRAPRGGVDAFYSAGGQRWFTVRLRAAGLYRSTSSVTPPGERVATVDVAATGRHVAAGWTSRDGTSRVRLARPVR